MEFCGPSPTILGHPFGFWSRRHYREHVWAYAVGYYHYYYVMTILCCVIISKPRMRFNHANPTLARAQETPHKISNGLLVPKSTLRELPTDSLSFKSPTVSWVQVLGARGHSWNLFGASWRPAVFGFRIEGSRSLLSELGDLALEAFRGLGICRFRRLGRIICRHLGSCLHCYVCLRVGGMSATSRFAILSCVISAGSLFVS